MKQIPDLSVIIPIYNEEDNLTELYVRLQRVLKEFLGVTYEIIFVDDGSRDDSWKLICDLNQRDGNVKGIRFSRNFGHHVAMSAGLDHAQGNAITLMDGDLQDPPEEIPKLYRKVKEGHDVVLAVRQVRRDPIFKKLSSRFFHGCFKVLCNVEISPDCGTFRIMSRRAAEALLLCKEKSRFLDGLISWTGFLPIRVATERDMRHAGKTKIGIVKSIRLAVDAITSFSYFPLRMAIYLGFVVSLISFLFGMYFIAKKVLYGIPVLGYASIIVAVLFIGGVQLIIIGIIGEYIGRIYTEAQSRPMYIVKDLIGRFNNR